MDDGRHYDDRMDYDDRGDYGGYDYDGGEMYADEPHYGDDDHGMQSMMTPSNIFAGVSLVAMAAIQLMC